MRCRLLHSPKCQLYKSDKICINYLRIRYSHFFTTVPVSVITEGGQMFPVKTGRLFCEWETGLCNAATILCVPCCSIQIVSIIRKFPNSSADWVSVAHIHIERHQRCNGVRRTMCSQQITETVGFYFHAAKQSDMKFEGGRKTPYTPHSLSLTWITHSFVLRICLVGVTEG